MSTFVAINDELGFKKELEADDQLHAAYQLPHLLTVEENQKMDELKMDDMA